MCSCIPNEFNSIKCFLRIVEVPIYSFQVDSGRNCGQFYFNYVGAHGKAFEQTVLGLVEVDSPSSEGFYATETVPNPHWRPVWMFFIMGGWREVGPGESKLSYCSIGIRSRLSIHNIRVDYCQKP